MEIWDEATKLHQQGKFAEAEHLYDQLLTQNHANPGLLATYGTLALQTNRNGLAIALLEASLHYGKGPRPDDVLSNLGVAYRNTGQPEKAKACLEESVKGNPGAPALANYAGMYIESGEQPKAIAACERALQEDPHLPIAHWNLGLMLLSQGQWERGWQEHEWGLKTNGMRVNREIGGLPMWKGPKEEPGKKIVIYGEQGIGDEIMFASMLPDVLKTNEVILECHERLTTLFEKSFPGVKCYGTREQKEPQWPANETGDCRVAIGSLGQWYRNAQSDFPGTHYLKAQPLERSGKFRVGISWTGGYKMGRIQKRSVPISWWKSILNVPNVEFVSLQYTDCSEELDLMDTLGYDIQRRDDIVKAKDYYETARLVASCDLVISVCTSVIHLAGALGVPCWVMTPKNPAWRYGNSGRMPWYRSVRLYRQMEAGEWRPVVSRIGMDLDELVASQRRIVVAA